MSALGRGCVETLNDADLKLNRRRSTEFSVITRTDAALAVL